MIIMDETVQEDGGDKTGKEGQVGYMPVVYVMMIMNRQSRKMEVTRPGKKDKWDTCQWCM